MKRRVLVQIVASVVVLVFAVGIWSTGDTLEASWLRFFSAAVIIALAVLWLWDRVLWKLSVSQKLHAAPRNISGTWEGTLVSVWEDSSNGVAPDPKAAYLVVRQTATTVSAILLTDESTSVSSIGTITEGAGIASLEYLYRAQPDVRIEDRSRAHHGSALLHITGIPPTRMRGRYWTDRDSRGELDFTRRVKQLAEDCDEATGFFE